MFSKRDKKDPSLFVAAQSLEEAPSFIAPGTSILGDITSGSAVHVEGKIVGDINADHLTIGDCAEISGSISGNHLHIAGSVKGKLSGDSVILKASARVVGDVYHKSLSIEAGAYIEGACIRQKKGDSETTQENAAANISGTSLSRQLSSLPDASVAKTATPHPSVSSAKGTR